MVNEIKILPVSFKAINVTPPNISGNAGYDTKFGIVINNKIITGYTDLKEDYVTFAGVWRADIALIEQTLVPYLIKHGVEYKSGNLGLPKIMISKRYFVGLPKPEVNEIKTVSFKFGVENWLKGATTPTFYISLGTTKLKCSILDKDKVYVQCITDKEKRMMANCLQKNKIPFEIKGYSGTIWAIVPIFYFSGIPSDISEIKIVANKIPLTKNNKGRYNFYIDNYKYEVFSTNIDPKTMVGGCQKYELVLIDKHNEPDFIDNLERYLEAKNIEHVDSSGYSGMTWIYIPKLYFIYPVNEIKIIKAAHPKTIVKGLKVGNEIEFEDGNIHRTAYIVAIVLKDKFGSIGKKVDNIDKATAAEIELYKPGKYFNYRATRLVDLNWTSTVDPTSWVFSINKIGSKLNEIRIVKRSKITVRRTYGGDAYYEPLIFDKLVDDTIGIWCYQGIDRSKDSFITLFRTYDYQNNQEVDNNLEKYLRLHGIPFTKLPVTPENTNAKTIFKINKEDVIIK